MVTRKTLFVLYLLSIDGNVCQQAVFFFVQFLHAGCSSSYTSLKGVSSYHGTLYLKVITVIYVHEVI